MQQQQQTTLPPLRVPPPGGDFEDWKVPEADEFHRIVIESVGDTRNKQFGGKVEPDKFQVRLQFRVEDPTSDDHGVTWWQWFGYSLHEKATLRKLLEAIGGPLDDDETVDLKDYAQRAFSGYVVVDEVPARDDPERIMKFAKVTVFKPIKKGKKSAPPPEPDEEDEGEGEDPFAEA